MAGFGEFGAEVAVVLAPDDQGGRFDWDKRGFGAICTEAIDGVDDKGLPAAIAIR